MEAREEGFGEKYVQREQRYILSLPLLYLSALLNALFTGSEGSTNIAIYQ